MRVLLVSALSIVMVLTIFSPSMAEQKKGYVDQYMITTEIRGCEIDMKQHCKKVTPGNNREILCLAAFEDQLLDECKIGILESAIVGELGMASLDYAYEACGKERATICGDVKAGEGRLMNCIKSNQDKVSKSCITALKQTGFWNATLQPAAGN